MLRSDNYLTPAFSVYLDLVRFSAALVVVLHHVWPMLFSKHPLPWPGHDAVVVFFVLSGLVIANATDRPDRTLSVYIQHRTARIGSVAIPALLLSVLVALAMDPHITIYGAPVIIDSREIWSRVILNLFFIAQSWSLDLDPPFNAPYWSLNFEVWYYILFGTWVYAAPRWRGLVTLLAASIAGPKILLLMPVWLLGVAMHRIRIRLSERTACLTFVTTLVVASLFFWFDVSIALRTMMIARWPDFMHLLHGANQFLGDILLGLIVSANFIAASNLNSILRPLLTVKNQTKMVASFTFSTYLYHMPLFSLLWGALGLRSPWAVLPFLILGIMILGQFTEKQLPFCRRMLERIPI
jgi:peptidoglycan/LPS O-acetylase OafA/YrhL